MAQKNYRNLVDIKNPHRAEALTWELEAAGIPYLKYEHYDRQTIKPKFFRFYVKIGWIPEAWAINARLEPSPEQQKEPA